jgi:cobalt-zinc-cadmium efflux system membrane fusion protein
MVPAVGGDENGSERPARPLSWRAQLVLVVLVIGIIGGVAATWSSAYRGNKPFPPEEMSAEAKRKTRIYRPKDSEWASLTIESIANHSFNSEFVTEGKIQVNEDRSTPIFSPYAGRVTRLFAKAGDVIQPGQPLFVVEATDMVQAQNDFIAAITAMNKARSALNLAQITDKRSRDLYAAKAVPLKETQNAQAGLVAAQNDMRSAETALEAARNRLRILGRSDGDIDAFEKTGRISPDTPVFAPIGGTIVQRKIGPGQYVSSATSDPVFVVGDLANVWLTAFVRETDAGKVAVGEDVSFTVLAYPDRVFKGKIDYVAAALDPASRRLMVRATIDNSEGLLKPEMFASVTITVKRDIISAAAPREALIYEGNSVRAWVARDDKTIELRRVKTGIADGSLIQIVEGADPGERIVVRGSLFIDRVATGG